MTPLHHFGEYLRNTLLQIPLPVVRVLFVATLVMLLVWVMCLPKSMTTPESGTKRWDENLKIGAGIALILQLLIYIWM
jgi:hypothetical protein